MARKPAKKQIEKPKKDLSYDPIYTSKQAAEYLGYSYDAFRRMRSKEGGPVYILFGGREKRYQLSDLNAWKALKREETLADSRRIEMLNKVTFFSAIVSHTIKYHVREFKRDIGYKFSNLDVKLETIPHEVIICALIILAILAGVIKLS